MICSYIHDSSMQKCFPVPSIMPKAWIATMPANLRDVGNKNKLLHHNALLGWQSCNPWHKLCAEERNLPNKWLLKTISKIECQDGPKVAPDHIMPRECIVKTSKAPTIFSLKWKHVAKNNSEKHNVQPNFGKFIDYMYWQETKRSGKY